MVLYNPEPESVREAVRLLSPQVDAVVLVDNSEGDNSEVFGSLPGVAYFPCRRNLGIAAAQNMGIMYLKERHYEYVLFSDQDSVCTPGLVEDLMEAHRELSQRYAVAAVGPMPVNEDTGREYFNRGDLISVERIGDREFYNVSKIVSSYSLIRLDAFDRVGLYNESLFIDAVESSWCFRAARYHGLHTFLVPDLKMSHVMGVPGRLLGRQISISSPFRIYYQFRNLIWESREDYAPAFWKKRNLLNILPKLIYYPLMPGPRLKYMGAMFRGLRDGIFMKYRMNVPQYSGTDPSDSDKQLFSDWIRWYQVQPLNEKMKSLCQKIPIRLTKSTSASVIKSLPYGFGREISRLYCFGGHVLAAGCGHGDSPRIVILKDIPAVAEIERHASGIAFVLFRVTEDNGTLVLADPAFYPGNGLKVASDAEERELAACFRSVAAL